MNHRVIEKENIDKNVCKNMKKKKEVLYCRKDLQKQNEIRKSEERKNVSNQLEEE